MKFVNHRLKNANHSWSSASKTSTDSKGSETTMREGLLESTLKLALKDNKGYSSHSSASKCYQLLEPIKNKFKVPVRDLFDLRTFV